MKLSEQTCPLFQSQELDRLGVTAESEYLHAQYNDNEEFTILNIEDRRVYNGVSKVAGQAYTVAELLQALPKSIGNYDLTIHNSSNYWHISYVNFEFDYRAKHSSMNINLPVLLADCLIHLLTNNLLTAEQVNEAINTGK